jgi:hypothetical protein
VLVVSVGHEREPPDKGHKDLPLGASRASPISGDLVEWGPSTADLAAHPDWRHEVERPAFLLIGGVSGR